MERLRALNRYSYGTRALLPGDIFEANAEDAALIVQLGNAERAPAEPKPQEGAPESTPQDGSSEPPPPKKPRTKRGGYLRRDERAQD